jgi:hypothetical protein
MEEYLIFSAPTSHWYRDNIAVCYVLPILWMANQKERKYDAAIQNVSTVFQNVEYGQERQQP